MQEQELAIIKGVAATLEYMASSDKLDIKYTKEALSVLVSGLYQILEETEE